MDSSKCCIKCKWFDTELPGEVPVRQVYGIFFDPLGRIFLQNDHGRYNLPGGKPEGCESWEETLEREAQEESMINSQRMLYLGFVLVSESCGSREYPYAQVRYAVKIQRIGPLQPDPSTGRVYDRILVPAELAVELLNWGEHGHAQIASAVAMAQTYFSTKLSCSASSSTPQEVPIEGFDPTWP
jgi:8-oxo-dGTP pyrophosphatase MutT (NUDIX family)